MATVANLGSIRIEQRYGEHHPPHFHAIQGNEKVSIRIADLGIEKGSLNPGALRTVLTWARDHRAELALNWVDALAQQALQRIPVP
jgi:hypothetical protein